MRVWLYCNLHMKKRTVAPVSDCASLFRWSHGRWGKWWWHVCSVCSYGNGICYLLLDVLPFTISHCLGSDPFIVQIQSDQPLPASTEGVSVATTIAIIDVISWCAWQMLTGTLKVLFSKTISEVTLIVLFYIWIIFLSYQVILFVTQSLFTLRGGKITKIL